MDDLKLFSKSEEQIDTFLRTVYVFTTDIGMEFGMKKCGILTMKRRKIDAKDEKVEKVGKEEFTYLGIVELDKIKENKMKERTTKEYKRSYRLVLKSKLNGKNNITTINAWILSVFRYGAGILQWKESELKDGDRKKGKQGQCMQRCGQIVRKEERGRQKSDKCGTLR